MSRGHGWVQEQAIGMAREAASGRWSLRGHSPGRFIPVARLADRLRYLKELNQRMDSGADRTEARRQLVAAGFLTGIEKTASIVPGIARATEVESARRAIHRLAESGELVVELVADERPTVRGTVVRRRSLGFRLAPARLP